ncbi:MAG: hypothetical protein AB1578_13105 [Thermodesulfobacteriota bacterium]
MTGPGEQPLVLIVEGETGLREIFCRLLTEAGYSVLAAADGERA